MKKYKIPHLKKSLISIGLAGAIVAPLATVVSCTSTKVGYGETWKFDNHNIVQITTSTDDGISSLEKQQVLFQTPLVTSLNSVSDLASAVVSMALAPFRVVVKDFDEKQFDKDGRIVAITPNRETALRFEMVDQVTFEFQDGSKDVFDNDTDGDFQDDKQMWHYSINGEHFKQTIAKGNFKNIRFHMRLDLSSHHWIQQLTGKKSSAILADDLWRGAVINTFRFGSARASDTNLPLNQPTPDNPNITSVEKIDNAILASFDKSLKNSFSTGTAAQGSGTFFTTTYGLDGDSLLASLKEGDDAKKAKEKFLPATNTPENSEFVLPFSKPISSINAQTFWNENFVKLQTFCAISDTEIRKAIDTKSSKVIDTLKKAGIAESAIDTLTKSSTFKSGFYQWESSFRDEQFVAGKYYFAQSSTKLAVAKYNEDYVDTRWLNQKNSKGKSTIVKEFRLKYIQTSQASDLVLNNEYKTGTSVVANFSNFDSEEQTNILQNLKSWGVTFIRSYSSAKGVGGNIAYSPFPFLNKDGNIYFNNNFAKLLYGNTLSSYKNSFVTDDATSATSADNLWNYQMDGNGLQFRSNFMALLNGTGFWKAINVPDSIGWPTVFAPEGEIGKDANGEEVYLTNVITNPEAAANNGVDDEKVLAYNVSNTDANGKIETHALPFKGYLDNAVVSDIGALGPSTTPEPTLPINPTTNQHYSPFEWVKKNINESIDKMFGPLQTNSDGSPKVDASNELLFEMPYGNNMTGIDYNKVYQKFADYLKTVDPRLKMVAAVNPASEAANGTDASVRLEKWTDEFSATAVPQNGQPNYSYQERLNSQGKGYSFASIGSDWKYFIDSPVSLMFDQLGYLQTGILFTLSYWSNHMSDIVEANEITKPFKPLIEYLIKRFDANKAVLSQKFKLIIDQLVAKNLITQADGQKAIDAVKGSEFTFQNLYKSSPTNIAVRDFGGFYGLEGMDALYANPMLQSIMPLFQDYIGEFTRNAGAEFDADEFAGYSTQDKLLFMQSFESFFFQNFQPFTVKVGDRRILTLSLNKNWYNAAPISKYSNMDLSWARVDLDHVDPSNPLSKVEFVNVDENGKPIVY